jgi:hypothetical protein
MPKPSLVRGRGLLALLASMTPPDATFPEIDDPEPLPEAAPCPKKRARAKATRTVPIAIERRRRHTRD